MDHNEAVERMTAERYLLDELTPDLREAFEEHYFSCTECALDLRAAAAFIQSAKVVMPRLSVVPEAASSSSADQTEEDDPEATTFDTKKRSWFDGLRKVFSTPAFAMPVFATLLVIISYQNFVTLPALRSAVSEARQPRLLPWSSLYPAMRGAAPTAILVSRKQDFVVPIELDKQQRYASYTFSLYDSAEKRVWTTTSAVAVQTPTPSCAAFSLMVPSAGLKAGSYTLAVNGITQQGTQVELDRRAFDLHFID